MWGAGRGGIGASLCSDRPELKSRLCHLVPLWFVARGVIPGLKSAPVNWHDDVIYFAGL